MNEEEAARAIEANVDHALAVLRPWAPHWAARYNGPVYLTGSVLCNPTPRDIDLRIVVADHEFAARYGYELKDFPKPIERGPITHTRGVLWSAEGPTQRWVDDLAKTAAHLSIALQHNVDLQVWPSSQWRDDAWPKPLKLAEPSGRWMFYNKYHPKPAGIE